MTVTVCDLSQYQIKGDSPPGTFDFGKLAAQNVDGVIYRITCQPTLSDIYTDRRFMDYVSHNDQVACAGYYAALRLERNLQQQLDFTLDVWRQAPPARIWLDLEGDAPAMSDSNALYNLVWLLQEFETATHIKPGIYTRQLWFDSNIATWSFFREYPLWAARYTTPSIGGPWADGKYKFRDWDTWALWQYTDRADGILHGAESYQIDKNLYNGDALQFAAFVGGEAPMIRQIKLQVVGAVPDLPCYADGNAPYGNWTRKGTEQFRLGNGEVVITVDLAVLTATEALKFSNSNGYQRVWLVDPANPENGVDYDDQELWVESSHLAAVGSTPVEEPEPEPVTNAQALDALRTLKRWLKG